MFITASTSQQIYNLILKDKFFDFIFQKFSSSRQVKDELTQITWEAICNIPEDKLVNIWNSNQFKYFFVGIVKNQIQSSSSPLHRQFRIYSNEEITDFNYGSVESTEENIINNEIEKEKKELKNKKINVIETAKQQIIKENPRDFVYVQMFELYYEGYSFRKMANKLKLPKSTCFNYVKIAEKMIKEKIKDIY